MKKILVIGSGTIAQKHAINIMKLNKNYQIFFCTNNKNKNFNKFLKKNNFFKIDLISQCKNYNFFACFVCSPATYHLKFIKYLYKQIKNFFIEKPIFANIKDLEEFKLIKKNKLIQIGYNFLFDKKIIFLKKFIKKNKNKKLLYVDVGVGQNIKQWRPEKKYYNTVTAQKKYGGGSLLELSHEINNLVYLFGKFEKISSTLAKLSDLKINVEDFVNIILKKKKTIFSLTMDILRSDKTRFLNLIYEDLTIEVDFIKDHILFKKNQKIKKINLPQDNEYSYREEIKYFFKLINLKKKETNISHAIDTLKIIEAARKSSKLKSSFIKICYK